MLSRLTFAHTMQERIFKVSTMKAEGLFYALFIIAAFLGFISLFSKGIIPLVIFGAVLTTAFFVLRAKMTGKYYFKVNDKGIEFRHSIFQKASFLSWDLVDQVTFHLYEINLRLRDTNRVINFQTNHLDKDDVEVFTDIIRDKFNRVSACDKLVEGQ